jgi:hypothetical protein
MELIISSRQRLDWKCGHHRAYMGRDVRQRHRIHEASHIGSYSSCGVHLRIHRVGKGPTRGEIWTSADRIVKIVVFLVMGDRGGEETWTTFSSNGWPTVPLSCLVGIVFPVQTLIGSDAQAHLAEETMDAARVVPRFAATTYRRVIDDLSDSLIPRAMVTTALVNYIIGLSTVVVRRNECDDRDDRLC